MPVSSLGRRVVTLQDGPSACRPGSRACVPDGVGRGALASVEWRQQPAGDLSNEIVFIDGERQPDLVPQWRVWEYALRVFARGAKLLPSALAGRLTADESSRLFREAEAHLRREAALRDYLRRLSLLVIRETGEAIDERRRIAALEYRRGVLESRDRLLGALAPPARAALDAFVTSQKARVKLAISKRELAWYLRPE